MSMESANNKQLSTRATYSASLVIPRAIEVAGTDASRRFLEYFAARIRNKGTRQLYYHACCEFFDWCDENRIGLADVEPIVVATYVELLMTRLSAPSVKVKLAAIKMLFDHLVTGHIVATNPAASVKGPKHIVKKGKTPVLDAEQARELINSIDTGTIIGLRDRALIGIMVYSFARISAVLGMNVEDYYPQGRRMWFRLLEKNSKHHEVPAHHLAESYMDAYIQAAGIESDRKGPLFRTIGPDKTLSGRRMHRVDALRMVKRKAVALGLPVEICNHTWRATGITAYLKNGGSIEHAKRIACHESANTTKLYDRTSDDVSLDEIERIRI